MNKYHEWISNNVSETYGMCAEITLEMQMVFPELERVRGHYYCPAWGDREHWWLTDGSDIIDPTASQFPSKGEGVYTPLDESLPEPTGKCPNCGEYCYEDRYLCSDDCAISYTSYLNSFR